MDIGLKWIAGPDFIESYYSWFEIDILRGSSTKIVIEKVKRASA